MKKIYAASAALLAAIIFTGCGGGNIESLPKGERIFFIKTYEITTNENGEEEKTYVGVPNVFYDCGEGERLTTSNGGFRFTEGENCTFNDLDDSLSKNDEVEELYITDEIGREVEGVEYNCISRIDNITDSKGKFYFDAFFGEAGDSCKFYLKSYFY